MGLCAGPAAQVFLPRAHVPVATSTRLRGCEMSLESGTAGFSVGQCILWGMERETAEWKERRNTGKRMLSTEGLGVKPRVAVHPGPAGVRGMPLGW